MPRVRYTFEGGLEVLSPLHCGSGEYREVALLNTGTAQQQPRVAAIARDIDGKPYVPATTIKGALRRIGEDLALAGQVAEETVVGLFGHIKDESGGRIGAVLFRGAALLTPADATLMPYGKAPELSVVEGGLGPGVFVAARARLDRATGSADDHKLFFQEMVAAKAVFRLRLSLEGDEKQETEEQAKALAKILGVLAAPRGAALGKGQSDGQGQVGLRGEKLILKRFLLGGEGAFKQTGSLDVKPAQASARSVRIERQWRLRLKCEGPFIVLDSSWTPPSNNEMHPQLKAQRIRERLPLILGSSIMGALRARAAWLAALEAGTGAQVSVDDCDTLVRKAADIAGLTPAERLFGVTGYRALLEVGELDVSNAATCAITSVKLDRFSGEPIDNALFKSATFINTCIDLRLDLIGRGTSFPGDADFAEKLIADIGKNGLELGHGANKGFGWFEVSTGGR